MAPLGQRSGKLVRWSICRVTAGVLALAAVCCLPSLALAQVDAGDSQASAGNNAAANRYEKYLSENAKLPGVTKTLSGLQYSVLATGDGPQPGPNTPCVVHYRGTLIDGRRFDGTDSTMFGFPALFAPSGVIQGWSEALQMMHEGDKWRLVIPAHLAYGSHGAGDMIPPGATLVFTLELVKVFEGTTARSYPGSFLLENVLLGPIPDLGYFCVRMWMVLLGSFVWMWFDSKSEPSKPARRRR